VRAETVSGDVNISNSPNVAIAKTISGDVTAQNVGAQTTLVLSTISGTVLGTGLKVRALEAGSVSGNVRLIGSEVERPGGKVAVRQHRVRGAADQGRPLRIHLALGQRAHHAVGQHRLRARCRHVQRERAIGRPRDTALDGPDRPEPARQ
jgi:DUF4097 and DUF4098 domain-containing protein YvlB